MNFVVLLGIIVSSLGLSTTFVFKSYKNAPLPDKVEEHNSSPIQVPVEAEADVELKITPDSEIITTKISTT